MDEPKEGPWTYVEGVRRRAWLRLSHRERLEWLWQAKRCSPSGRWALQTQIFLPRRAVGRNPSSRAPAVPERRPEERREPSAYFRRGR